MDTKLKPAVLTLTMWGIIYCISLVLKCQTQQHLTNLASHTPFLFTLSHLQPACLYKPASSSHTPHWHAARSCRPLLSPSPSQTEWEKFTLALFLFFRCSVRQLLWWWDTKTSVVANVQQWEEHWGCVLWVCLCPA